VLLSVDKALPGHVTVQARSKPLKVSGSSDSGSGFEQDLPTSSLPDAFSSYWIDFPLLSVTDEKPV
jgi:hypothetical protein